MTFFFSTIAKALRLFHAEKGMPKRKERINFNSKLAKEWCVCVTIVSIRFFFMTCLHFSVNIVICSQFFPFILGIVIDTGISFISLRVRKKNAAEIEKIFSCLFCAHFPLHLILCRHLALLTHFRVCMFFPDYLTDFIYFYQSNRPKAFCLALIFFFSSFLS